MADPEKESQKMDAETSQQLEVDCIVTTPGIGYYDPDGERSRLSQAQPLTGHPPPLQNGLDGDYRLHSNILRDADEERNGLTRLSQPKALTGHPPPPLHNELDGDYRLHSSIVRDGRLQSGDYRRRIKECTQAKQRATEEIDRLYQMCEDLCAENEKLLAEKEQLQAEDRLCRNCKLSLSLQGTETERTLRERHLVRQLEEAETQKVQLQHRCKELLDEVTRLRGSSLGGGIGDVQNLNSFEDPIAESLTDPKQTESVGNACRDVDPVKEGVNTGNQDQTRISEQTYRPMEVEKANTPSPDECAIFLADHIRSGNEINTLLRHMNLNSVAIADLEERHPKDPKERRIDGIKTGIASSKGDRITFLLDALEKSKLNRQADLLCEEFNIQRPQAPTQASRSLSSQKPLQASGPDDFADSPCLEPQSDFETILEPFLLDPVSIHTIAVELAKERDFTVAQLKKFKNSFPGWKESYRRYLTEKAHSRCPMDVLNIWAQVEVERRKGVADKAQGIEMLVSALRESGKNDVLETLRGYLRKGVVGPSFRRDVLLRSLAFNFRMEIIRCLGLEKEPGHDDWRALTEEIGYGKFIPEWEKKTDPAQVVWGVWVTRDDATVGNLYNWAISKNRIDIAGLLES